jgi:hypothetical protein
MEHLHDPKCVRTCSAWGGMGLCKQWCCGVQHWPLWSKHKSQETFFTWLAKTRLVGTPWVWWACMLCTLRCPNRRCHNIGSHWAVRATRGPAPCDESTVGLGASSG